MNAFEAAGKTQAERVSYKNNWKICSTVRTKVRKVPSIPATFLQVTVERK